MNKWHISVAMDKKIILMRERYYIPQIKFNPKKPVIIKCPNPNCDGRPINHKRNDKMWGCHKCGLLFEISFTIYKNGDDYKKKYNQSNHSQSVFGNDGEIKKSFATKQLKEKTYKTIDTWQVISTSNNLIYLNKKNVPQIKFNPKKPVIVNCPDPNCKAKIPHYKNEDKRWRCPKCDLSFSLTIYSECGMEMNDERIGDMDLHVF